MKSHAERLTEETKWYDDDSFRPQHILNRWPFYSRSRNLSAYRVAKEELFRAVAKTLPIPRTVLVAPCGHCDDYQYIREIWPEAHLTGLDIAPYEGTIVGDILNMPFRDGQFDVVVSTLFFHHIADEGFDRYLREMRRVAKSLVTMEPSRSHPMFWLTRPAKKIAGNITGQVPHEHPISITALAHACSVAGYDSVQTFACSFAHNRLPIPLRPLANSFRGIRPMQHLAWLVGFIAQNA